MNMLSASERTCIDENVYCDVLRLDLSVSSESSFLLALILHSYLLMLVDLVVFLDAQASFRKLKMILLHDYRCLRSGASAKVLENRFIVVHHGGHSENAAVCAPCLRAGRPDVRSTAAKSKSKHAKVSKPPLFRCLFFMARVMSRVRAKPVNNSLSGIPNFVHSSRGGF